MRSHTNLAQNSDDANNSAYRPANCSNNRFHSRRECRGPSGHNMRSHTNLAQTSDDASNGGVSSSELLPQPLSQQREMPRPVGHNMRSHTNLAQTVMMRITVRIVQRTAPTTAFTAARMPRPVGHNMRSHTNLAQTVMMRATVRIVQRTAPTTAFTVARMPRPVGTQYTIPYKFGANSDDASNGAYRPAKLLSQPLSQQHESHGPSGTIYDPTQAWRIVWCSPTLFSPSRRQFSSAEAVREIESSRRLQPHSDKLRPARILQRAPRSARPNMFVFQWGGARRSSKMRLCSLLRAE